MCEVRIESQLGASNFDHRSSDICFLLTVEDPSEPTLKNFGRLLEEEFHAYSITAFHQTATLLEWKQGLYYILSSSF